MYVWNDAKWQVKLRIIYFPPDYYYVVVVVIVLGLGVVVVRIAVTSSTEMYRKARLRLLGGEDVQILLVARSMSKERYAHRLAKMEIRVESRPKWRQFSIMTPYLFRSKIEVVS